jgi:indole-3-glycerol phosphate synthase
MSANFLESMAVASRRRVETARRNVADYTLFDQALDMPPPPALTLHERFDLIAEIKLRSPASGALAPADNDLGARISAYAAGGAAAVSVLTEPSRFDGSLDHLTMAARALEPLGLPVIRKDFLIDPYQLAEARIAGAGGALIILRLLKRAELKSLIVMARGLKLLLLLEAFDERDLQVARQLVDTLGPDGLLVGVNSRDLATLQVVPSRLLELAEHLPQMVPCVAESGLHTPDDVRAVANAGYRLALVGSALMQASTPEALVKDMLEAGRTV